MHLHNVIDVEVLSSAVLVLGMWHGGVVGANKFELQMFA